MKDEYYDISSPEVRYLVRETEKKYKTDLRQRLLNYAVNSLKLLMKLPHEKEFDVIRYQLSKSATSIGANYEEAQASTEKEFVQKVRIALREANESKYWYKIILELEIFNNEDIDKMSKESNEISLILGSIVSKMNKKIYK
jgi:four helix bundle protein